VAEFTPFWQGIKADVVRLHGTYRFTLLLKSLVVYRTFKPIFTLRLCQAVSGLPGVWRLVLLKPCKLLHILAQNQAGLDLPWETRIGPGFCITHGWGLVVTGGAVLGGNVTAFHGVTIGQKDDILPDGQRISSYPIVEDEVWLGPHALVVGGVRLGRGSRIAGGAVVVADAPPYSIIGGNPGRVMKTDALPDVYNPAEL
jgi:serine O-acetyltransferase